MNTITKEALKSLRVDLDAALALVGSKHGISIKSGSCTFSPLNATFKVNVCVIEDGAVVTKELATLRQMREILGLKEEHLTQVISWGGKKFTLAGYINTGRDKPFLVKNLGDGKFYTTTEEQIFKALGITSRFGNEILKSVVDAPPRS